MKIGEYNELEILRFTSVGAYLGDEEDNDVLLPQKLVKESWQEGDKVRVFIYRDSEDRIIATTLTPWITLHRFSYLKVRDVNFFGAFLEWGIEKDLMVPFQEQQRKLEAGQRVLVYLRLDDKTDRLVATTKIAKYIEPAPEDFPLNEPVEIMICDKLDLGVRVIVNQLHSGIIYNNDINKSLVRGTKEIAYVYKVRKDGRMDVRLEKEGYDKVVPLSNDLYSILKSRGGTLHLSDKSHPDEIRDEVGMSKKTFKKAVGNLYRQKLIVIHDDYIQLA